MAKTLALLLILLQIISFTTFAEEIETLHHKQTAPPLHPPIKSHVHPPLARPPHHHHHSTSHAPSRVHTPLHPPHPAKPPTHHRHHHPSAHAPIKPLVYTTIIPTHPPLHPPVPAHSPKINIFVQGAVYVKSCNYSVDPFFGATPLHGAVVRLQCNTTKYIWVQNVKTNKDGYFYILGPQNITTYADHRHCKVVLISAPNGLKPSNLNGGITGDVIRYTKRAVSKGVSNFLFTADPLVFEPNCSH